MTSASADFSARVRDRSDDLISALRGLYGDDAGAVSARLVEVAEERHGDRRAVLVERDTVRLSIPDWWQQPERVGYIAYVDRFGGTLAGVRERIEYLCELGVDVLHLLSLFAPRIGDNDGGYAIRDYLQPDPALGSAADLDALVGDLHAAGISLCVDFVLNHTSDDHPWAIAAKAGSSYHRDLFITVDDRASADEYEATLPEVFPHLAPGNFTFVAELDAWVWTTFREFQWDLNWANPDVMFEIGRIALDLANLGVDILRLDAIAFTWKRLGTNCQNQPEAHLVAQALKALTAMVAPSTALLAEAIVGPNDLVGYLGRHVVETAGPADGGGEGPAGTAGMVERRECDLAYHNQLMVQCWSMLATGETALARTALSRLPDPPSHTTWITYVRCHDDIGWAIDDRDARDSGVSGAGHRTFLAEWFRGDFPMSPACGVPFATNDRTGDERTCGMTSSLTGVEAGLAAGDEIAVELGVRRALLLHAIAFGYGGIPMIYMGDEIGLGNDHSFGDDPARAEDSRWIHRPPFDAAVASRRHDNESVPGRFWAGISRLVDARASCRSLHGAATTTPVDAGPHQIFAWIRRHPRHGLLIGFANVSDRSSAVVDVGVLGRSVTGLVDVLDPGCLDVLTLAPLQVRWLTSGDGQPTVPAPPASTTSD